MSQNQTAIKVAVGMSGGVDSSVAAYLLKKEGYDVIGVTLQTLPGELPMIKDAKEVAEKIGIPHFVIDVQEEFQKKVVDPFIEEYLQGRTPNPCVLCNRYVKWEALLKKTDSLGVEYVATGHYARIKKLDNGRYVVQKSVTDTKDQAYVLHQLTQEQLKKTWMPIGDYTKDEVRKIAREIGLSVAEKADSQDICFIPDHDYAKFIKEHRPDVSIEPGEYVDQEGNIVGTHKGVIHYTVGQRKGLQLSLGKPVFVTKIDPKNNRVMIGDNEDCLQKELIATRVNYMPQEQMPDTFICQAKIRYAHKGALCTVYKVNEDKVKVVFEEPQRAVTPGQSVVFYDGDCLIGGGIITSE